MSLQACLLGADLGTTEDRDGDGLDAVAEARLGTDARLPDSDGDSLDDGEEVDLGTDPTEADTDDDGLSDADEIRLTGTSPRRADTDGDGLSDHAEHTQTSTDPLRADTDGDGLADGNARDPDPLRADTDGDGLSDGEERARNTNPSAADSDGDGLPDGDEVAGLLSSPLEPDTDGDGLLDPDDPRPHLADTDQDGLDDVVEASLGTDPTRADTDGDGLTDAEEVRTDPLAPDSDGDSLTDGDEVDLHSTDPASADSDADRLDDGAELALGTDPLAPDSDADGLADADEVQRHGTDPLRADSDEDGLADADEVRVHGTDPTRADTDADGLLDPDELAAGADPRKPDSDADGLADGREVNDLGTDPTRVDSDADRLADANELAEGTDPLAPDSDGDTRLDGVEVLVGSDPLVPDAVDESPALGAIVRIPAGRFDMGSPSSEVGRPTLGSDTEVLRTVELSRAFWVMATELTQARFEALTGTRPSASACVGDCPVDAITFWDALAVANLASAADGLPACYQLQQCTRTVGEQLTCVRFSLPVSPVAACAGWRLPSDAEWEFAARSAGVDVDAYPGGGGLRSEDDEDRCIGGTVLTDGTRLDGRAVYCYPEGVVQPVRTRPPTLLGLYDVVGNVEEWVEDVSYFPTAGDWLLDPTHLETWGPVAQRRGRVVRGGSARAVPAEVRLASTSLATAELSDPHRGVRLVRTAEEHLP